MKDINDSPMVALLLAVVACILPLSTYGSIPETTQHSQRAQSLAAKTVEEAELAIERHEEQWHAYWQHSSVHLEDEYLESVW